MISDINSPLTPWLPRGFYSLSGLPEVKRKRRLLMPLQLYVDESGTKGNDTHFVMMGMLAEAEQWAKFSNDWQSCLDEFPEITVFKMREAMGGGGDFRFIHEDIVRSKVIKLGSIITQYVKRYVCFAYDFESFQRNWLTALEKLPEEEKHRGYNDPYFWAYCSVISGTALELWDEGHREGFEVIFDSHRLEFASLDYYHNAIRGRLNAELFRALPIMPIRPQAGPDEEYLPLQASDMFAWMFRRAPDRKIPDWCNDIIRSVPESKKSIYYDGPRWLRVLNNTGPSLFE